MLILSRKPGEKVIIGNGITVTVVSVLGNKVRLAGQHVPVINGSSGDVKGHEADPTIAGDAAKRQGVTLLASRPMRQGERHALVRESSVADDPPWPSIVRIG